jgi:hypothetical protein
MNFQQMREQQNGRARAAIRAGTEWRTAAELQKALSGIDAAWISSLPERLEAWTSRGEVFRVEIDGLQCYPAYIFNAYWQPLPAVRDVISLLSGEDPMRLAAWFESSSSFLGGKKPREVVAENGAVVVAAARDLREQQLA